MPALGRCHASSYAYLCATTIEPKLLSSTSSSLSLHSPDLCFDQTEPHTQRIMQPLLTTPSKHGCQHWEHVMPVVKLIYEQQQASPNFFQATAPPSCSTHLTCVPTRKSHAPRNHPTIPHYTLQTWMPALGRHHASSYTYLCATTIEPKLLPSTSSSLSIHSPGSCFDS
jgi:hypothetical protein